jgi:hypothetical protein
LCAETVIGIAQLDVDDPGDRVRPILGRCAVFQHFDLPYQTLGNEIEIGRIDAAVVAGPRCDLRTVVAAFAVDEHQRIGGTKASVDDRADDRGNARLIVDEIDRWQQSRKGFAEFGTSGLGDLAALNHIDRRRTLRQAAQMDAAQAGDDNPRCIRRRFGRSGIGGWRCGFRRFGRGCACHACLRQGSQSNPCSQNCKSRFPHDFPDLSNGGAMGEPVAVQKSGLLNRLFLRVTCCIIVMI